MYRLALLFVLVALLTAGCVSQGTKGGKGNLSVKETTTIQYPDGTKQIEVKETTVSVDQPNAADKPATMTVKTPGGLEVNIGTGSSFNIAKDLAAVGMLQYVMWFGVALIVIAGIVFYFTRQLIWCLILAGSGMFLIVASYLLAAYPIVFLVAFMIAGAAILAYCGYLLWSYQTRDRATRENVDLIGRMRKILTPAQEHAIFDTDSGIAAKIQSPRTRKLVNQLKLEV